MDLDNDSCFRALKTRDARFDGRIFVGVRTTGIYCRPICPARTPLRENVSFYPSAAAAQENGFRPCLRCRPETAPDLGAWRGTSNTVARALRLIDVGAMDTGNVEDLAARLGVGGRHLRRLFRDHLGASPVAVAQTRRVLLARQLISDTGLSMAEVAMASGFGSIRRFNETFRQLYGRPPGDLRRKKIADFGGEVSVKLRYVPPYDRSSILGFLEQRAIDGVELISGDKYCRVISIGGQIGHVSLSFVEHDQVQADLVFPELSALPEILQRLRRVLDLGVDIDAVNTDLRRDRILAPLVDTRPGLRCPGAWDVFELAIRAILGQQISVAGAATLSANMCRSFGTAAPHPRSWPHLHVSWP